VSGVPYANGVFFGPVETSIVKFAGQNVTAVVLEFQRGRATNGANPLAIWATSGRFGGAIVMFDPRPKPVVAATRLPPRVRQKYDSVVIPLHCDPLDVVEVVLPRALVWRGYPVAASNGFFREYRVDSLEQLMSEVRTAGCPRN
jgi:hypothetical protein